MSYTDLTADFGRFDRDNMHRWETAGYLNWANAVLGDIVASHKSHKVSDLLERADDKAARAIHEFKKWDYLESAAGPGGLRAGRDRGQEAGDLHPDAERRPSAATQRRPVKEAAG